MREGWIGVGGLRKQFLDQFRLEKLQEKDKEVVLFDIYEDVDRTDKDNIRDRLNTFHPWMNQKFKVNRKCMTYFFKCERSVNNQRNLFIMLQASKLYLKLLFAGLSR